MQKPIIKQKGNIIGGRKKLKAGGFDLKKSLKICECKTTPFPPEIDTFSFKLFNHSIILPHYPLCQTVHVERSIISILKNFKKPHRITTDTFYFRNWFFPVISGKFI